MPGTTRYSATFDRPYEESSADNATANGARRSRSHSLQVNVSPYTPLAFSSSNNRPPQQRSSSTDSGGSKGAEGIPTRVTSKPAVKTHNNPFQFVKVGSCPLYRKAEEQIKKVKEVVKLQPEVVKEEEEEWQSNLDSWKSRRRKMSEDIFRRQEEIRQFESEEQTSQAGSKKIKTFSEMVESRAHRGRTMSLCLISSPLELQQWELENQNKSHLFSEESEENSAVNSEDEGVNERRLFQKNTNGSTNGNAKNGSAKNKINKMFELGENCSPLKDGIYCDSGLESISSSHRTGDTPDSCSDFSQDSGSSIDCDSPRASGLMHAMNLLEEYNSKSLHHSDSSDSFPNMKSSSDSTSKKNINREMNRQSVQNGNEKTQPNSNGCQSLNKEQFSRKNENSVESSTSELSTDDGLEDSEKKCGKHERSIESENEVFVDDFEELGVNGCSTTNQNSEKDSDIDANVLIVETSDCSKSLPSIDTTKPENSSAVSFNISTNSENKIISVSENSSNLKFPKSKKEPFDEENAPAKSVSHSDEKKPVLIKKETKEIPRKKKRATAKIVSVEINQKADSNKTPETVQEESLSVVFQSVNSTPATKTVPSSCSKVVLNDVLPVEQIAEEMEKLILQQLEEEERAKELSSKPAFEIAPPRKAEPPKEKPPPPPPNTENEVQKTPSLKRINSTKRIKKEIHKRRSNFLGIEADEGLVCDDSVVPPPNALEQMLKAELELDRESMKRLDSAAAERLKFEENEIIEKEREIIANLETEEMQRHLVMEESCNISPEEDRIQKLKEERKRIDCEKTLTEAQRLRLTEEKQLREREEFIKKQEEFNGSSPGLSPPLLSDAANILNVQKSPNASSLCSETQLNVSPSGDGNTVSNSASQVLDAKAEKAAAKPAVPPKPVKKKEAIRKERERLRQEQEALQKEREEHRLKLIKEQELLKSSQKPNAPVSRLGPVPPAKPKLTASNNTPPIVRENVIFTSQSYHGAQNGISSRNGCGEPMPPVVTKLKPVVPSQKKVTQKDFRVQQKAPLVRKPSQDSSPESKYNQNHWLIQEAEMRRIAELKERQHIAQYSLPQDDSCGNPRLPNVPPPVQDKVWSYARPSVVKPNDGVIGMYPPPAKPSRVVPLERPEQILSVSGRKKCSHCLEELGRGAAMIIESLQLYYHIQCFQCCVCQAQLGNGSCGTDVRVRNHKLHCHNCYSNDEAGLKFSQV